jgi:hypothetical protein
MRFAPPAVQNNLLAASRLQFNPIPEPLSAAWGTDMKIKQFDSVTARIISVLVIIGLIIVVWIRFGPALGQIAGVVCIAPIFVIATRFRYTIRDVLWLTVVVALAIGWFLDHWHWYNESAVNYHKAEEIKWQVDELLGEVNILKGENDDLKSQLQKSASVTQP